MTGNSPAVPLPSQSQDQNLINPSKIDTSARPPGRWRALCLDVVAVLSAALFGYLYYRYLTQGLSVWFLLAALMFFGVASVMEVFLAKNGWRSMFVIVLETAASLGFFWRDDPVILGSIAAIMIVMLLWGHFSSRSLVRERDRDPVLRSERGHVEQVHDRTPSLYDPCIRSADRRERARGLTAELSRRSSTGPPAL